MGVWLLLRFFQYLMLNSLSPAFVANHLTNNIHSHVTIISLTRLTFLTGRSPGPSLLKKMLLVVFDVRLGDSTPHPPSK